MIKQVSISTRMQLNNYQEITTEKVYASMFPTDFRLSKWQENKYELRYFELVE